MSDIKPRMVARYAQDWFNRLLQELREAVPRWRGEPVRWRDNFEQIEAWGRGVGTQAGGQPSPTAPEVRVSPCSYGWTATSARRTDSDSVAGRRLRPSGLFLLRRR